LILSRRGGTVAALTQDPKSKMYRILFWFGGRLYHKSLKTTEEKAANAKKGSICIGSARTGTSPSRA